jgi:hypothetical protein
MTAALHTSLKRLETVREGFVVRNLDGSQKRPMARPMPRSSASADAPVYRRTASTASDTRSEPTPRCSA